MSRSEDHNAATKPILRAMLDASGSHKPSLCVLTESILLGVAMLHFPDDGRKQALLIQEIADGASDRARSTAQTTTPKEPRA